MNSGEYRADALLKGDYIEIPLRNEINRDDIRRGAAIVSEAHGGRTPPVTSFARAPVGLTRPKLERRMNGRDPASRIKKNTAGSSEEALFARDLVDLPHTVLSTAVNKGDSLANAMFDEDYSEIPPQIEMNRDDKEKELHQ